MFNRAGAIANGGIDADLQYIGATVDTANQTNYTFSGVNIGTPTANRVVVIGYSCNAGVSSVTIGGVAMILVSGTVNAGLAYKKVASGTTANIVISAVGSNTSCIIYRYTVQAVNEEHLDAFRAGGSPLASLTAEDVETRPNGAVIAVSRFDDGEDYNDTWTGNDTFVRNYSALVETQRRTTLSAKTTEFSTDNDLTIERLSGTSNIQLAVISF